MGIKERKIILSILLFYSILILYFMFFGFDRPGAALAGHEYRFDIVPKVPPLNFPNFLDFTYFQLWFFNLGNLLAYIPFGILIFLLYPLKFLKFIILFFLSILFLETIQMLTLLGSFDINDAIVNTLGAAIGFHAMKMGGRFTKYLNKMIVTAIFISIFSIGVIGFSELLNKSLTKTEGSVIALNEIENSNDGEMDKNMQSFEIGGKKIEPAINVYSGDSKKIIEATYQLEGEDIVLSINYGIPDNAENPSGQIIISVDGVEVDAHSVNKEERYPASSETLLEKVHELTVTVDGEINLWDITLKELKYWWN